MAAIHMWSCDHSATSYKKSTPTGKIHYLIELSIVWEALVVLAFYRGHLADKTILCNYKCDHA